MSEHAELFHQVYQDIKKFLLDDAQSRLEVDDNRRKYLEKMMDTTTLGGKYNRGLTVVEVGAALTKDLDAEARKQYLYDCCVCGWMIEMMQAHFLVEDDIMDSSQMRRGKPCWYLHPGVTTQSAINDGLIILAWTTKMAVHFFRERSWLGTMLDLFHDTDYRTTIGQLYDVSSMYDSAKLDPEIEQPTTTDYKEFTLNHYKRIVKFKTAYYTYYAPLVMGLVVCTGLPTAKVDWKTTETLACIMGEYFQIQDDFLDCFGDPKVIGKVGTDIQDTKCSWLAVTFLGIASEAQRQVFVDNYGSKEDEKVERIKALYRETDIEGLFKTYEEETVKKVEELLGSLAGESEAFTGAAKSLWQKTYKRQK